MHSKNFNMLHLFRVLLTVSSLVAFFAATGASAAGDTSAPATNANGSIESWCSELKTAIDGFKWKGLDPCQGIQWKIDGTTVRGRPLVYAEFGDPKAENVTLILTAVHGDEITPVYLGIKIAHWVQDNVAKMPNTRIVIAPLVNPDGFYTKPRTRMNANGVDVNRNFDTRDWNERALMAWKKKFRSDPRRFPGSQPRSEPETRFQEDLIRLYHPKKILSVHSPLNHLDYDGPNKLSLARFPKDYVQECLKLRTKLRAVSTGYFPGSLGNYAGQELGIPTITLELPTANPNKAEQYWKTFSSGIRSMIQFVIPEHDGVSYAG